MAEDFRAKVTAELDTAEAEGKLQKFLNEKNKLKIDVELNQNSVKKLSSDIEKGVKQTRLDTSFISQQLADSFNISDKSVINKIKSQLNSMIATLGKTWDGTDFNIADKGFQDFFGAMEPLKNTLSEHAKLIHGATGIYDKFFDYFKDKKIYISDALKSALGEDTYKELLQNNIGKIVRDATKGVDISSIWDEMKSMFPEHFSDNIITQAEQLTHTFDLVRKAREDMTQALSFKDMDAQTQQSVNDFAWKQASDSAEMIMKNLKNNIQQASEISKTTIDLDVNINTDKITSDIRNAIKNAGNITEEPLPIDLRINEEQLISSLRSAVNKIASGDEPVKVDVQINKEGLQSELHTALSDIDLPVNIKVDADSLADEIRAAVNSITDIEVDLHINTNAVRDDVGNIVNTNGITVPMAQGNFAGYQQMLNNINAAGVRGQSVFQKLGSSMKETFSVFTMADMFQDGIYKIIDAGKQGLDTVKEFNDLKTDLAMATGDGKAYVNDLMKSYNDLGQELGAITSDVASSADSWLRQGRSMSETNQLIKDSMVLSKDAQMDSEQASKVLTATLNGFQMNADQAGHINDVLTSIDLQSGSAAYGIGEALSRTASEGDNTAITQAKKQFDAIDFAMSGLAEGKMSAYADQIAEVRSQLNETAIATDKFNKAVKGQDSSDFGKGVTETVTALKELSLSDTDFKYAFETDGIQAGEEAVQGMVQAALDCGVISDTSASSVNNLVSMLVQLGVISNSTGAGLDSAANAVSGLTTEIEAANSALSGINAATSLLTSQGTGKSISIEDFNSEELQDYTSALEYNNGALQLNAEKVRELQKAKAEEAIQTNDNLKLEKQSQYMENIAEIEELQDKLNGLSDAKSKQAETIQSSIDALLTENDSIVNQCSQLDLLSASLREATGAYQNWLDKQNTTESGDMFDDALGAMQHIDDTTQNTDSEYYGRIGRESYQAAVELIIPESVDGQNAEAVQSYMDSIEHYFLHDEEGSRIGLDVAEFCQNAVDQGLMTIDEASGQYQIAGQTTMQDFVDGMNLSMPVVQAMFGELKELGGEFSWADEAIHTLGDLGMAAGEAKARIEETSGGTGMAIQIDVSDIDTTEGKISALENTISQMQQYKGTVGIDSSQVQDANSIIQYCITQKQMLEAPAIMSVDASQVDGEIGNAISLLQQFQNTQNTMELQASVGADTSEAEGQLNSLAGEIQALSPEVKAKLGIDGTSVASIQATRIILWMLNLRTPKLRMMQDRPLTNRHHEIHRLRSNVIRIGKILEQFGIKADQMGISKGDVDVSGFVESQQNKPRSMDDNIVTLTRSGGRTIVTENGVSTPMSLYDDMIPSDMTEKLINMSMADRIYPLADMKIPEIKVTGGGNNNVNIRYDGPMLQVQGDMVKSTLPDLKTILEKSNKYTQNEICKNLRRFR